MAGARVYFLILRRFSFIEHLTEKTYFHTRQIITYVEAELVSYTVSGINKWLHHHGFAYKKPKGVPHKARRAASIYRVLRGT